MRRQADPTRWLECRSSRLATCPGDRCDRSTQSDRCHRSLLADQDNLVVRSRRPRGRAIGVAGRSREDPLCPGLVGGENRPHRAVDADHITRPQFDRGCHLTTTNTRPSNGSKAATEFQSIQTNFDLCLPRRLLAATAVGPPTDADEAPPACRRRLPESSVEPTARANTKFTSVACLIEMYRL